MTTDELETLMEKHWKKEYIPFYLAEVLLGEVTVKEQLENLLSFEKANEKLEDASGMIEDCKRIK